MAARKPGDIRRRWELRVLVALPAVWILFAAVEGYLAIYLTLEALGYGSTPAPAGVDGVRLLVIGGGSLLALACGASLAVAVTWPMRDLLRKIQHRLRGDAAVTLTAGNEVQQLSNAFNDMLLSFDKFVSDTAIIDGLPLGVVVVDANDVIVRANAQAHRLLPGPVLLGTPLTDVCGPAMAQTVAEVLKRVRASGAPVEMATDLFADSEPEPDAEPKHMVTLHPTTTIGDVVVAIRDLGQLASIRGQIQRVDQLAAVGAHVASVAHELGGGLMGIQTLVDTLQPTTTDRRLHERLQLEVERATRLLTEIRMFGQATARDRVTCSVNRIVEETLAIVEPRFARKRIQVTTRLRRVAPLSLERDRIVQAVLNVLTNAFEATPDGGRLDVDVEETDDSTRVSVANTGSFIPPEQREKVFTLFYTTKRGGSGFGLPQARRALVDHGGDIEVASSPEEGTTFVLRFPAQAQVQALTPAPVPESLARRA